MYMCQVRNKTFLKFVSITFWLVFLFQKESLVQFSNEIWLVYVILQKKKLH